MDASVHSLTASFIIESRGASSGSFEMKNPDKTLYRTLDTIDALYVPEIYEIYRNDVIVI